MELRLQPYILRCCESRLLIIHLFEKTSLGYGSAVSAVSISSLAVEKAISFRIEGMVTHSQSQENPDRFSEISNPWLASLMPRSVQNARRSSDL
ncbi:hypothetical protein [Alkalicoccus daliensis]|uniref:Uncharacterized protein n=1 Tax=Alkalicoccus daliensis TaxID=745820 RepID=A0A1H0L2Y9_9BACI|nr:hypothetical protein [Alkalicoccus daliensis]SDO62579.1 hypothetical protein SAMN04488053_1242 [Alkalicoccus daliensis]